jgi:replicative DNA helicase
MSDLRETGAIEQDADVILLLHREDMYHKGDKGYSPTGIAEVIVEKQRNGPTGLVSLVWRDYCTRFESLSLED